MNTQEKFELLIDELESYIEDEAVAIRQDNWAYLAELLRKKENHLKEIGRMKPMVDEKLGDLPHQLQRIKAKEVLATALMAEKMDAARAEISQSQEARQRVHQMRQHVQLRGYQVFQNIGGAALKADA